MQQHLASETPAFWRLRQDAQQCLKAAHLPCQDLSLLEEWLGPVEELAQHATGDDMDLLSRVREPFFRHIQVSKVPIPSFTPLRSF